MRAILSIIFFSTLTLGCGTTGNHDLPKLNVPPQSASYFLLDHQNTTLIRAFEDGHQRTMLQFADMDRNLPELYDANGEQLRYRRIGSYAVIDGVISRVVIRQAGRLAIINHPSLPIGYADYPLLRNSQRLAVRLIDAKNTNEPKPPALTVRQISDHGSDALQRDNQKNEIFVRPIPRRQ